MARNVVLGTLAKRERQVLLRIAREAVAARVNAVDVPAMDTSVKGSGGAFVTLRIARALRGCIGHVEATRPLAETVQVVAMAAAADDPRFPPVRPEELAQVVIEVSVIGLLEPCLGPAHVEIGRHGLVVDDGVGRGLLLPQVAVEWGWDGHTFLSQACVKAGLRPDAWRDDATIFRFEAQVFGEDDPSL